MDVHNLEVLLTDIKEQRLSVNEALEKLKDLPYEDLGFAKVDHHRGVRSGHPEVVFCQGKTTDQVIKIMEKLALHGSNILATRANGEQAQALMARFPGAVHNELARCIVVNPRENEVPNGTVLVISAGTADL
ncbi:MAG TPA: 1-(5-phosphoribosyl)-5-amino-4-imidazole-carboxylate carboxylase, partial [Verrucomicrobiae bacterium]|nr:1-(5-phosphoribosyl)-5-amino-4-imidazole-carboxylate carboxylase [Verrucomicrobiae bacterium]